MDCPKCKAAMELVTFESIEVDRCTGCKGIFFDNREAERLRKVRGSEAIDVGDAKVGKAHDAIDRIRCPRDTAPMVRIVDPQQPHIRLETCPVCNGTFFDAGEFRDWKHETLVDLVKSFFAKPRD
jgi:Zn-finger nucleic acid-binding protein